MNKLSTLYLSDDWINGNYFGIQLENPIVKGYRKGFLSFLQENIDANFATTIDEISDPDNTLYITMLKESTYQERQTKIKNLLPLGISFPHSVTFQEFLDNPFFPAVFKNEYENRGNDKIAIRDKKQLEVLKRFYDEVVTKDKNLISMMDGVIIQELITGPIKKLNTSIRVFADATGDQMAKVVYHAENKKINHKVCRSGSFDKHLMNSSSPYFISDENITSTINRGMIVLGQGNYNHTESNILKRLGIDPRDTELPDIVTKTTQSIGPGCNRELGITCGLDFIFDENKKCYFIEANNNPGIGTYAATRGYEISGQGNPDKAYIDGITVDIIARTEAINKFTDFDLKLF
ncbi:MAG: hypothetical protein FWE45_02525 [Firmicutes bacterium]|nr:hypothetical protein [Bacillota bacterium]